MAQQARPECPLCNLNTQTITHLRQKISELEYSLYWKNHNMEKLTQAMMKANMSSVSQCNCSACSRAGFYIGLDFDSPEEDCLFRPRLEEMFAQCDLTTAPLSDDPKEYKEKEHCSNEEFPCFETDCHIVLIDHTNPFIPFAYGAKLWKAKLGSEDLKKLENLFSVLKPRV